MDSLAWVFGVLQRDLREDVGKELFLLYSGVAVVLPFMAPASNPLCRHATDIFLQMAVDSGGATPPLPPSPLPPTSPYLPPSLPSCPATGAGCLLGSRLVLRSCHHSEAQS